MNINFKEICKKYEKEALDTLIKDCSINSVYDEKTVSETMPYGKGVHDCFKKQCHMEKAFMIVLNF